MSALLEVRDLATYYAAGDTTIRALDGVSFTLGEGEVLGIVGESGCGKSTLGRTVLRLVEPTAGSIRFQGEDITRLGRRAMIARRRQMQVVFQDPFGSLNPRHRVGEIVVEPLEVHGIGDKRSRAARVAELRVRLGLAMLFISHGLSVIRNVSDRIAVMYLGRIVEIATTAEIFDSPAHPYTRALLSAVPHTDPARRRERILLPGEMPDPAHPPSGCAFHTRCHHAMAHCPVERPLLTRRPVEGGPREVACHLF